MSRLLTLTRREMGAYFYSPLAYIVMTAYLRFTGFYFFAIFPFVLQRGLAEGAGNIFHAFTMAAWLLTPFLTMRLVAEERGKGTIEVLMTAPVTETQVILSKYLAAVLFFIFLHLPTLVYVWLLAAEGPLDPGPMASGYLGVLFVGATYLSMGLFISSTTASLVIAGLFSIFLNFMILVMGGVTDKIQNETLKAAVKYAGLYEHHEKFVKGVFNISDVVFYVSVIALFLFLSVQSLGSRRWR